MRLRNSIVIEVLLIVLVLTATGIISGQVKWRWNRPPGMRPSWMGIVNIPGWVLVRLCQHSGFSIPISALVFSHFYLGTISVAGFPAGSASRADAS